MPDLYALGSLLLRLEPASCVRPEEPLLLTVHQVGAAPLVSLQGRVRAQGLRLWLTLPAIDLDAASDPTVRAAINRSPCPVHPWTLKAFIVSGTGPDGAPVVLDLRIRGLDDLGPDLLIRSLGGQRVARIESTTLAYDRFI